MEEHLSIGKMAKLAGVSEWALRHYDSIGLLHPVYVSKETGYRYYHPSQSDILTDIAALKAYGFSLGEIKALLDNDEAIMREHYQRQYFVLTQERDKLNQTLAQLSQKIKKQKEVALMDKKIMIVDDVDAIVYVAASAQPERDAVKTLNQKFAESATPLTMPEITIPEQQFAVALFCAVNAESPTKPENAFYLGIMDALDTILDREAAVVRMRL